MGEPVQQEKGESGCNTGDNKKALKSERVKKGGMDEKINVNRIKMSVVKRLHDTECGTKLRKTERNGQHTSTKHSIAKIKNA